MVKLYITNFNKVKNKQNLYTQKSFNMKKIIKYFFKSKNFFFNIKRDMDQKQQSNILFLLLFYELFFKLNKKKTNLYILLLFRFFFNKIIIFHFKYFFCMFFTNHSSYKPLYTIMLNKILFRNHRGVRFIISSRIFIRHDWPLF